MEAINSVDSSGFPGLPIKEDDIPTPKTGSIGMSNGRINRADSPDSPKGAFSAGAR